MIVLAFLVMFLIAIIIGLVVELGKQGKALEDAEELLVEQDARLIKLTAELEDLRRENKCLNDALAGADAMVKSQRNELDRLVKELYNLKQKKQ